MRPTTPRRSKNSKEVRSRPQKEQRCGSNRRSERLQEKQQQSSERSIEQEDEDHYLSSSENSDRVQQQQGPSEYRKITNTSRRSNVESTDRQRLHSPTRQTRASFRQLQLSTSPAQPSTIRGQPLTPSTLPLRSSTYRGQPSTPPRQPSTSRAQPSTSRAKPKSTRKGVPKKKLLCSAKYINMTERIRVLQEYTGLLIPKACFIRLVREILIQFSYYNHYRVTQGAIECLQESAELYITHFFEDAYMHTLHRKRVTLNVDDMRLVRYIRGVNDPGSGN